MTSSSQNRKLSISIFIPSIITILGTSIGLLAIRYAFQGEYDNSIFCIIIAAIIDTVDGRMARLLNATSNFGAELDSLSDLTVFGIAPAIVIFQWKLHEYDNIGWAISTVFIIACALRLARFNVTNNDEKPASYRNAFFQGVPAPAAALLSLYIMVLSFVLNIDMPTIIVAIWIILIAILMVSNLPTFSFKKIRISRKYFAPTMLGLALSIAGLLAKPWLILNFIAIAYLITFPISFLYYQKLKKQSESEPNNNEPL